MDKEIEKLQDRVLSLEMKNEEMRGEMAVLKKAFAKAEKTCAKNHEALSQAIKLLLALMKGSVAEICCKMILLDIKTEMVMEELDVGIDDMAGVVTAIRQTVAQQMGLARDDDGMDGDQEDMAGRKKSFFVEKDMFDDEELVKMGRVLRTVMRNEINVEEEDGIGAGADIGGGYARDEYGTEMEWVAPCDDGIIGHSRYCDDGCDEEEEDDEDEELMMMWNVLMDGKKVMS